LVLAWEQLVELALELAQQQTVKQLVELVRQRGR